MSKSIFLLLTGWVEMGFLPTSSLIIDIVQPIFTKILYFVPRPTLLIKKWESYENPFIIVYLSYPSDTQSIINANLLLPTVPPMKVATVRGT